MRVDANYFTGAFPIKKLIQLLDQENVRICWGYEVLKDPGWLDVRIKLLRVLPISSSSNITMRFKRLSSHFPSLGKTTDYALLTKRNYNSTEGIETPQRVK